MHTLIEIQQILRSFPDGVISTNGNTDGDAPSVDFGLKAARVRIENRFCQRPNDLTKHSAELASASNSCPLESDGFGDVTAAEEVNWRRGMRRARDAADGRRTKKMNGRLSKHQQHRWASGYTASFTF